PRPENIPDLETPIIENENEDTQPFISQSEIIISGFVFNGNTVFSDNELNARLEDFLNKPASFEDIIEARDIISNVYLSNGYITSGAIIPVDSNIGLNPEAAVITFEIIEGTIEDIQIISEGRLRNYINARARAFSEPVLNQNDIEEGLRLLQISPLINSISAEIAPGSAPGRSILIVQ
ncbi:MAG: POTRA domain-containing protein, partial [Bacteroidota bacterium]